MVVSIVGAIVDLRVSVPTENKVGLSGLFPRGVGKLADCPVILHAVMLSMNRRVAIRAMDFIISGITALFAWMGIDTQFTKALPVAFMKPLSGSGARGLMVDAMTTYGADSFVGRLACTMQGTTDTTFYIVAVYFGSVGIKNTRYAIGCGLLADLAGFVAAILVAYLFFG